MLTLGFNDAMQVTDHRYDPTQAKLFGFAGAVVGGLVGGFIGKKVGWVAGAIGGAAALGFLTWAYFSNRLPATIDPMAMCGGKPCMGA